MRERRERRERREGGEEGRRIKTAYSAVHIQWMHLGMSRTRIRGRVYSLYLVTLEQSGEYYQSILWLPEDEGEGKGEGGTYRILQCHLGDIHVRLSCVPHLTAS
jgi:hypothetical protein